MAESKRTFQAARMNKDIEEKILKPGEYRDALNVSVDFSEDGNIGAIENLKGNELLAGQDILGLSSSSNPNAKVIGSIAHPEEEKIYFFVTGDKMDGIFEYDLTASSNQTKPIVLDSVTLSTVQNSSLNFSQIGIVGNVSQDGTISLSSNNKTVSSLTSNFAANTTGSAISRKITASAKVPSGFQNEGEVLIGSVTASQPSISAPAVITQNAAKVGLTTATLSGSLTNNSVNVTAQGFYRGFKTGSNTALTISELVSGGSGITRSTETLSTVRNNFFKDITGLPNSKLVSYAAFATNSVGTTNGNVKTFTTETPPPVNRVSGSEYFLFPNIANGAAAFAVDEVDARNVGYGTFYKATGTSLDYKTMFMVTGPSNTGQYANRAIGGSPSFSVTPSGPSFTNISGTANPGIAGIRMHGTTIDTSYQVTVSGVSGFNNKTFRVNVGSPSGTFHTSTLSLNLTGVHVASANIASFEYNVATSSGGHGPAVFVLGPVQSGEKMACCIPLNDTATTFTTNTAQSFVSSFNPSNLSVTVTGKTEGVAFDYYVENTSTAIFGNVPGIIFEGTPSLLGTNPTVNITYTT